MPLAEMGGFSEERYRTMLGETPVENTIASIWKLEASDWAAAHERVTGQLEMIELLGNPIKDGKMSYHKLTIDDGRRCVLVAHVKDEAGNDVDHIIVNEEQFDLLGKEIELRYWEFRFNRASHDFRYRSGTGSRAANTGGWSMALMPDCAVVETAGDTLQIIRGRDCQLPLKDTYESGGIEQVDARMNMDLLSGFLQGLNSSTQEQFTCDLH